MRDIDTAVVKARFNDDVSVILITGHGHKFFREGPDAKFGNSWIQVQFLSSCK